MAPAHSAPIRLRSIKSFLSEIPSCFEINILTADSGNRLEKYLQRLQNQLSPRLTRWRSRPRLFSNSNTFPSCAVALPFSSSITNFLPTSAKSEISFCVSLRCLHSLRRYCPNSTGLLILVEGFNRIPHKKVSDQILLSGMQMRHKKKFLVRELFPFLIQYTANKQPITDNISGLAGV